MTRIVHLTDLHFGCERAELVEPLHQALRTAGPDLIVVSGDLTHRARPGQFRQAMAFLNGLGLPFIAVPGNHDMPLFNVPMRIFAPFRAWRRGASAALTPDREAGQARIFSANTADPFRWRRGRLRPEDIHRIGASLPNGPDGVVNILACHHPFEEPPGFDRGETRGAGAALPALIRGGLRVILSGHLHHWTIGLGITETAPQPVLMVQTGTALCARPGERSHGFALLDIAPTSVTVTPWIVGEQSAVFRPAPPHAFAHRDGLWHRT